jgi:Transposase DDE domain group 1
MSVCAGGSQRRSRTAAILENAPSKTDAARLTIALVDQFGTTVTPGRMEIFDIDDTCVAHGGQQLAFWNAHHDERGFAPMHIYHAGARPWWRSCARRTPRTRTQKSYCDDFLASPFGPGCRKRSRRRLRPGGLPSRNAARRPRAPGVHAARIVALAS